nr:tetratricopeptide repeat protein [Geotalea uraniireducens]
MKFFRTAVFRCLTGCLIIASLLSTPAFAVNSEDSQIFIAGFNAYQKKDFPTAIEKMKTVLDKYPDTPLRDMAIFWLARANFKAGYERDAAKYMSQFFKEYPDSPLKGTVEDDLLNLVARYDKGEQLPVMAKRTGVEAVAAEQAAAKKALAEKTALARQAAEAAAREKVAAEQAAVQKAAAEKAATEKAAQEKLAAEKAAADKAAQEKLAAEKAVAEQAAQEKLAAEKAAADKAAQEKLAAEKAAADKAAQEKLAAEKAAADKAAQEKLAAEKASADKAAQEKLAAEKAAAEQAAQEKLAAEKAAAEQAAQEKLAAEKASADKAAQEKLAAEKAVAEKAAQEKLAAEKAAAEQAAQEKLAAEKAVADKAAQEKLTAEKAAQEKAAAEQLAAQKAATEKAAAEKLATELRTSEAAASAKASAEMAAREQAARGKAARSSSNEDVVRRNALREKAIAEYKSLIDRFPGTRAAAAAVAKLQELGIAYPEAVKGEAAAKVVPLEKNARILSLEVGQYADVDLSLLPTGEAMEVGKRHELSFEVVNRGNGPDSFFLESGFPPEFNAQFADAAKKEVPINLTPVLAPGERFRGVLSFTVPREYIDGQKIIYPIKVASRVDRDASQARDIFLTASAPLLRAVVKTDKTEILPGQKVVYRIALLNIGTAAAQGVTLRLNYPPQYEPVGYLDGGFKQEMKAALVIDGMRLASGESREFEVAFQLKEEALAQQELYLRADVVNNELQTRDSFLSVASLVQAVSGVAVRTNSDKLVVIPGQPVSVPLIVTNTGNVREDFLIKTTLPPNISYTLYQDLNRDGIRQSNEPIINHVGPLAPKEESYVILDLSTPNTESDGTNVNVSLSFEPESDRAHGSATMIALRFSRPVIDLVMNGKGGRLKPGEVSSFELNFANRGSSMAKMVELQSFLPTDLELVASDPPFIRGTSGDYRWKFDELGAGEKRAIKVTFRVRTGTAVGTNIQVKNILKYQDQLGNRY